MEMTKKEEKKSDWYWEIGNKKTNNPNEVIAWLIVEKAKLEEENKNLTKCNLNLQEWLDNKEKVNKSLREENKKLKDKIKHLEFDIDAWYQLKLLLEGEIEKLKEERDKYYAEWHLRHS